MYLPIREYAILGDTSTVALVSSAGSIDWACFPDFNSPAVFLRLLDDAKGGYCAVLAQNLRSTSRKYREATNILETEFVADGGKLAVTDFMPLHEADSSLRHGQDVLAEHRIVRLLRCTEGSVECRIELKPTFDYARRKASTFRRGPGNVMFAAGPLALHAQLPDDMEWQGETAVASLKLNQGESFPLVLTFTDKPDREVEPLSERQAQAELERTQAYWEKWSKTCSYQGEFREQVLRSALTLKLLTYEPSGALVASPTTSLPEYLGGSRNWDYRYCWLRDSAFTLIALMNLGYFGEAHDFFHFLHRIAPQNAGDFQILYGIDGSREASEMDLRHLDGYRGSRPVRIGNGAAMQTQLDIYGELLHCLDLYWSDNGIEHKDENFERDFWPLVRGIADHVASHWADRDSSMWEIRGATQHFTHGVAMCWLALDRAVSMAEHHNIRADATRWRAECARAHDSFVYEGFNSKLNAYVQRYGSSKADASLLRLPLMGVLHADDPRMRGTVALIEKQLMRNGLVYRYDSGDDGIGEREGTFTACSFWLMENYLMQGKQPEAEEMFRHVISLANDVGLMSEELDPESGEQLGNFPQGFTHIAMINAAVRLELKRRGEHPGTGLLRAATHHRVMPHSQKQAA